MLNVLLYLLPISGEMILRDLLESGRCSIRAAFLPESFISDCGRSRELLRRQGIPSRVPANFEEDDLRSWVNQLEIDVGVSVGYDKKLPAWLIESPAYGTINMHPSLLPRYRGANPYYWILRNREAETGVTLHRMDEQLDTGPIIDQRSVNVTEDETMGTLFFHLNQLGIDMIQECLEGIDQHRRSPEADPQPTVENPPTAPSVNDRHLRIDWTNPYAEIEAHVRAANPFYGAYTSFRGKRVRIYELEQVEAPPETGSDTSRPGSLQAHSAGPRIRCADAWVHPTVVQVGQQYRSSGREFQRREREAFEVLDRVI